MKRTLVGLFTGALVVSIWACSSSTTTPDNDGTQPLGTGDGGSVGDVECTHPGAGKPIAGDRCECATTRNIAGEWSTKRTCREGDTCPSRDKEDTVTFTQTGTTIRAERGASGYVITGTLCGDVMQWNGGTKDGFNPECGLIRFSDDGHYVIDSCYVGGGECVRSHGDGCPGLKGQCTGTGAKKPEGPPAIRKLICN